MTAAATSTIDILGFEQQAEETKRVEVRYGSTYYRVRCVRCLAAYVAAQYFYLVRIFIFLVAEIIIPDGTGTGGMNHGLITMVRT